LIKGDQILSIKTTFGDYNRVYACLGTSLTVFCNAITNNPQISVNGDQFNNLVTGAPVVTNSYIITVTSSTKSGTSMSVRFPSFEAMQVVIVFHNTTENTTTINAAGKSCIQGIIVPVILNLFLQDKNGSKISRSVENLLFGKKIFSMLTIVQTIDINLQLGKSKRDIYTVMHTFVISTASIASSMHTGNTVGRKYQDMTYIFFHFRHTSASN